MCLFLWASMGPTWGIEKIQKFWFSIRPTPYQAEQDRCGFAHTLEFKPRNRESSNKKRKNRKKRVSWFNPPYSMDVETNVGNKFLKLLDLHFPPGNFLQPVLNRSTVKISYRCLPNMGAQVAKQNSKLLRNSKIETIRPPPACNCQKVRRVITPFLGPVTRTE